MSKISSISFIISSELLHILRQNCCIFSYKLYVLQLPVRQCWQVSKRCVSKWCTFHTNTPHYQQYQACWHAFTPVLWQLYRATWGHWPISLLCFWWSPPLFSCDNVLTLEFYCGRVLLWLVFNIIFGLNFVYMFIWGEKWENSFDRAKINEQLYCMKCFCIFIQPLRHKLQFASILIVPVYLHPCRLFPCCCCHYPKLDTHDVITRPELWRRITPLGSWASHWTISLVLQEELPLRVKQTWLSEVHTPWAVIGYCEASPR